MGEAVDMNHLDSQKLPKEAVINLDHGDPRMYEPFWRRMGEGGKFEIPVWQTMSYFSNPTALCWFLESEFAAEVERLHRLVGNAKIDGKYIVVGNGSSQLYQAALYALAEKDTSIDPIDVVSSIPYYSPYPTITSFLQSRLYQWAGDAKTYKGDGSCIEVVCSPNNPDGFLKEPLVKKKNAKTIHDLAYYWPQYAAISHAADHDIMLFTFSKCTGHAGTRIGWALVKDREVAKKMTKYMELNTIGVSKDSQLRAAKLLSIVSDGIEHPEPNNKEGEFFEYTRLVMTERWRKLREVVRRNGAFSLPEYPSCYCHFSKRFIQTHPAFAWMRCEKKDVKDCAELLKNHKMLTRSGVHFGVGAEYVRISLLDQDESFELFLERIASIEKGV